MSINYNIQAEIIDIHYDSPKHEDTFLVDSNAWYWLTYPRAILLAKPYQINDYPTYISRCRSANSLLAYSGFSFAELAHLIEKTEMKSFNPSILPKEYRHNYPVQRANVVAQVQAVWNQVKAIAASINLTIDEATTDAALTGFQTQLLDGYDLFILETMKKEGIFNIITDDGDFTTVTGIKVFTANRNVINAAQIQGKLVTR